MKTSEILDKAADVIDRNGWIKGDWYEPEERGDAPEDCPVCAGAAINIALEYAPDFDHDDVDVDDGAAADAFSALLRQVVFETRGAPTPRNLIQDIAYWNDEDERTEDQVLAALRAAAEAERSAGR